MICEHCKKLSRTEKNCAFNSGVFSGINYMCGTIETLEELALTRDPNSLIYAYDQTLIYLPLPDNMLQGVLVLSHYKRRGRCAQAVIMGTEESDQPRQLTLINAEEIIRFHSKKEPTT